MVKHDVAWRVTGALAIGALAGGGCGSAPEWQRAGGESHAPSAHESMIAANTPPTPLEEAPVTPGDSDAADTRRSGEATRFATPNVTRVTFAEEGADFDPCVSRDGERIVFASTQHRSTADIYVKRASGRVVTRLTTDPSDDVMPAISPDGTRIAFTSNRSGNWDIFVMPATGGKAVQVTSEMSDELHPSWSPDGSKLVFCRRGETSGRWELWVTEVGVESAPHFIGYGMFPKWCPTGATGEGGADRILYQLGRERGRRTFGVWTIDYMDGQSGNASEIISSAESALVNPAWSPDGQWIAYAEIPLSARERLMEGSRDGNWARGRPSTAPARRGENTLPENSVLWMIGADGGKVAVAGGGASLMPDWGFANRLYFVSNRGGTENIWSLDVGQALLAASGKSSVRNPIADGQSQPAPEESR